MAWDFPKLPENHIACSEPISYVVGVFDRRFDISYGEFLDTLNEAEAVWEESIGKELFVYEPEGGDIAINLIYDSRQEATTALYSIESAVEKDDAVYDALKTEYAGRKSEYDRAKNIYDMRVKVFNEKNNIYQRQVELWNTGERTSQKQFDELERYMIELETEVAELKTLETVLNNMVREINTMTGTLNRLAQSLNLNVEKFNTIGALRGESFTGGVYYQDEEASGIDVYEFSSHEKLVRILAHELGHALGLEHIDDPLAIMYTFNEGDTATLSETELAALREMCGTE